MGATLPVWLLVVAASAPQYSDSIPPRDTTVRERLRPAPPRTTSDLLVGRFPGVVVTPSSGLTGSGNRVRIRGHASFYLGNRPVVYADGVRIEGMAHDRTIFDRAPSPFDDINPDDVDSIVIVRGPAAGGTYGPEAATGVILVYTARGEPGPARWRAYAEAGQLWDGTDWPANYGGVDQDNPTAQYREGGCTLDAEASGLCTQDFVRAFSPLEARSQFRAAWRRRAGLGVAGGAGRIRYAAAVDAEGEDGIYRLSQAEAERLIAAGFEVPELVREPSGLTRLRGRASVDLRLPAATELGVWGSVGGHALRPGPDLELLSSGLRGSSDSTVNDGWATLPGDLFQTERDQDVDHRSVGVRISRPVGRHVALSALAGWHRYDAAEFALSTTGYSQPPAPVRSGAIALGDMEIAHRTLSLDATASYRVAGLAARSSLSLRQTKRTVDDYNRLESWSAQDGAPPDSAYSWESTTLRVESRLSAFYAQQSFAHGDRLTAALGVRADHAEFPGGGDGWVLHPNARVEWLPAGRDPAVRHRLAIHAGAGTADQRASEGDLPIVFYPPPPFPGAAPSDVRPERTAEVELGGRAELWHGRAAFAATFYARRLTDGLLFVPGTAGEPGNHARAHNTGVELGVAGEILRTDRVTWRASAIAWGNRSRAAPPRGLGAFTGPWQVTVDGYSIAGYFGRGYSFADTNGDGVIARSEVVGDTVFRFLGNPFPSHGASFWTEGAFLDRLRVTALLEYRAGHQLLNWTAWGRCVSGVCSALHDRRMSLERQAAAVAGRGPITPIGRTPAGFIEDADFVKLRHLAVTVILPGAAASRVGARGASLTLTGRNLLTWTKYTGADPEALGVMRPEEVGLHPFDPVTTAGLRVEDYMAQPAPRVWTVRLDIEF